MLFLIETRRIEDSFPASSGCVSLVENDKKNKTEKPLVSWAVQSLIDFSTFRNYVKMKTIFGRYDH